MYVHVVYMYVYSDKDNDAGEKIVDTVVTMFPTVTEFIVQYSGTGTVLQKIQYDS